MLLAVRVCLLYRKECKVGGLVCLSAYDWNAKVLMHYLTVWNVMEEFLIAHDLMETWSKQRVASIASLTHNSKNNSLMKCKKGEKQLRRRETEPAAGNQDLLERLK